MKKLTHLDKKGRARMVDVTGKPESERVAVAQGIVYMEKETLQLITDMGISKGNVLETARIAGIMAAKRVPGLIPLCHPVSISSVIMDFTPDYASGRIIIDATVKCSGKTGVEMEAMTAVSVAALTVYDMCKAVDRGMTISDIMLMAKRGGKTGEWKR